MKTIPYKVLLVDDERIIREGISKIINWKEIGCQFMGEARDGEEAFEKIDQMQPDIIITDIQMPKMNGLELIEKTRDKYGSNIEFVVLSGHDNFEFAKKAMYHGVQHYILKPCDQEDIIGTLNKVKVQLTELNNKKMQLIEMQQQISEVTPLLREKHLRDLLFEHYPIGQEKDILNIEQKSVKLILFSLANSISKLQVPLLNQLIHELLGESLIAATTIDKNYIVLMENLDSSIVQSVIQELVDRYHGMGQEELQIIISSTNCYQQLSSVWQEMLAHAKNTFYFQESVIFMDEEKYKEQDQETKAGVNINNIILAAKAGNKEFLKQEMGSFFHVLAEQRCEITETLGHCTSLIITLVKEAAVKEMSVNDLLAPLFDMRTSVEISLYTENIALNIVSQNMDAHTSKYSKITQEMLAIIEKYRFKQELSIKWVANNHLFMSADYLGKIFRKELNEGFTQYVAKIRIDYAKKLIIENRDYKIYQIADEIGFGDNPQYFYYVFKKYTGYTPLEFKEIFQKE